MRTLIFGSFLGIVTRGTAIQIAYDTVRMERGSFLSNPHKRGTPEWQAWHDQYIDHLIAELKKNPPRLR